MNEKILANQDSFKKNSTRLQYFGYLQTPLFWQADNIQGLRQLQIKNSKKYFSEPITDNLRLGKRVVRFVSFDLINANGINLLSENVQIMSGKRTIGELDCLLVKKETPIHLEVIFKFYLYDPDHGLSELERFIGANRKDSFLQKINKLKEKQLPLLYREETKPLLDRLNLSTNNIEQRVHFKAQLFMPYNMNDFKLKKLNNNCIKGYWIRAKDLDRFRFCKFYLPIKNDWLMEVQEHANYIDFEEFKPHLEQEFQNEYSPLCWFKFPDGAIQKIFVVWW